MAAPAAIEFLVSAGFRMESDREHLGAASLDELPAAAEDLREVLAALDLGPGLPPLPEAAATLDRQYSDAGRALLREMGVPLPSSPRHPSLPSPAPPLSPAPASSPGLERQLSAGSAGVLSTYKILNPASADGGDGGDGGGGGGGGDGGGDGGGGGGDGHISTATELLALASKFEADGRLTREQKVAVQHELLQYGLDPAAAMLLACSLQPQAAPPLSPLEDLLGPALEGKGPARVGTGAALGGKKKVLLYFSASWCPPWCEQRAH